MFFVLHVNQFGSSTGYLQKGVGFLIPSPDFSVAGIFSLTPVSIQLWERVTPLIQHGHRVTGDQGIVCGIIASTWTVIKWLQFHPELFRWWSQDLEEPGGRFSCCAIEDQQILYDLCHFLTVMCTGSHKVCRKLDIIWPQVVLSQEQ